MIGQRVEQVLGLSFANGDDPVATVLEWGVRALEVPVQRQRRTRRGRRARRRTCSRRTTTTAGCCSCSPPTSTAALADEPTAAATLLDPGWSSSPVTRLAAGGASVVAIVTKKTRLGLDLKGGVELVYQGKPTAQVEGRLRIARTRDQHHAQARRPARRARSRKSSARATNEITWRCPTSATPRARRTRSAGPRSCTSTTGSRT